MIWEALALKRFVKVSNITITKLDSGSKSGEAMSAFATTNSSIIFLNRVNFFKIFKNSKKANLLKDYYE